jgi:hypothetical protein
VCFTMPAARISRTALPSSGNRRPTCARR